MGSVPGIKLADYPTGGGPVLPAEVQTPPDPNTADPYANIDLDVDASKGKSVLKDAVASPFRSTPAFLLGGPPELRDWMIEETGSYLIDQLEAMNGNESGRVALDRLSKNMTPAEYDRRDEYKAVPSPTSADPYGETSAKVVPTGSLNVTDAARRASYNPDAMHNFGQGNVLPQPNPEAIANALPAVPSSRDSQVANVENFIDKNITGPIGFPKLTKEQQNELSPNEAILSGGLRALFDTATPVGIVRAGIGGMRAVKAAKGVELFPKKKAQEIVDEVEDAIAKGIPSKHKAKDVEIARKSKELYDAPSPWISDIGILGGGAIGSGIGGELGRSAGYGGEQLVDAAHLGGAAGQIGMAMGFWGLNALGGGPAPSAVRVVDNASKKASEEVAKVYKLDGMDRNTVRELYKQVAILDAAGIVKTSDINVGALAYMEKIIKYGPRDENFRFGMQRLQEKLPTDVLIEDIVRIAKDNSDTLRKATQNFAKKTFDPDSPVSDVRKENVLSKLREASENPERTDIMAASRNLRDSMDKKRGELRKEYEKDISPIHAKAERVSIPFPGRLAREFEKEELLKRIDPETKEPVFNKQTVEAELDKMGYQSFDEIKSDLEAMGRNRSKSSSESVSSRVELERPTIPPKLRSRLKRVFNHAKEKNEGRVDLRTLHTLKETVREARAHGAKTPEAQRGFEYVDNAIDEAITHSRTQLHDDVPTSIMSEYQRHRDIYSHRVGQYDDPKVAAAMEKDVSDLTLAERLENVLLDSSSREKMNLPRFNAVSFRRAIETGDEDAVVDYAVAMLDKSIVGSGKEGINKFFEFMKNNDSFFSLEALDDLRMGADREIMRLKSLLENSEAGLTSASRRGAMDELAKLEYRQKMNHLEARVRNKVYDRIWDKYGSRLGFAILKGDNAEATKNLLKANDVQIAKLVEQVQRINAGTNSTAGSKIVLQRIGGLIIDEVDEGRRLKMYRKFKPSLKVLGLSDEQIEAGDILLNLRAATGGRRIADIGEEAGFFKRQVRNITGLTPRFIASLVRQARLRIQSVGVSSAGVVFPSMKTAQAKRVLVNELLRMNFNPKKSKIGEYVINAVNSSKNGYTNLDRLLTRAAVILNYTEQLGTSPGSYDQGRADYYEQQDAQDILQQIVEYEAHQAQAQ